MIKTTQFHAHMAHEDFKNLIEFEWNNRGKFIEATITEHAPFLDENM
jgi:hypothetical protein